MNYSKEQKMLALSYLAYCGFWLHGDDEDNANAIKDEINKGLNCWKPIKDEWDLVWGPAVYAFRLSVFDDNLMYVVRNKKNPKQYVVVIRGTNPISLTNWLLEDFYITKLSNWAYGDAKKSLKPKISEATRIGFEKLRTMEAEEGTPGAGQSLLGFFQQIIASTADIDICFTGHSLGGALSPTMALWFEDIKAIELSPEVTVSSMPFAGPTPGNKDFSTYFQQRLGDRCKHIMNSLDIVPRGWYIPSLYSTYTIYAKHLRFPGLLMFPAISAAIALSFGRHYYPIKPKSKAKEGRFNDELSGYFSQVIYQHTVGYLEVLDMSVDDIPLLDVFDLPPACRPNEHAMLAEDVA